MTKNKPTNDLGDVVMYRTPDGKTSLEVRLEGDTVWLTQAQMAELFKSTKQNISLHTRNIFRERELREAEVVKESLTTARDGKKYRTRYFNLDVIISVGYRVKSKRGTQFRIWATQTLRDYLTRDRHGWRKCRKRRSSFPAGNRYPISDSVGQFVVFFNRQQFYVGDAAADKALTTDQGRGLVDVRHHSDECDVARHGVHAKKQLVVRSGP